MAERKFLSDINLSGNQLLRAVFHNASSAPTSPKEGQAYFNTASNTLLIYAGGSWVDALGANSATQLGDGTRNGTTYGIDSDGSQDDIILQSATTSLAGLLSAAKFNEIVANNAKVSNVDHPLVEAPVPSDAVFTDTETLTTLGLAGNNLTYVDENGDTTTLDLTLYLDDTNAARIASGTLNGSTGIATFTRDDASSFEINMSAFLDAITLNNTLTSDSTTEGLTAAQGKVLKTLADSKAKRYSGTFGNGSLLVLSVPASTHQVNSNGQFSVFTALVSTGEQVECEVVINYTNGNITIETNEAVGNADLLVTVIG